MSSESRLSMIPWMNAHREAEPRPQTAEGGKNFYRSSLETTVGLLCGCDKQSVECRLFYPVPSFYHYPERAACLRQFHSHHILYMCCTDSLNGVNAAACLQLLCC